MLNPIYMFVAAVYPTHSSRVWLVRKLGCIHALVHRCTDWELFKLASHRLRINYQTDQIKLKLYHSQSVPHYYRVSRCKILLTFTHDWATSLTCLIDLRSPYASGRTHGRSVPSKDFVVEPIWYKIERAGAKHQIECAMRKSIWYTGGVLGPALGPLVGVQGVKPPEALD